MAAVKYDLTIEKGAKFIQTLLYQDDTYVGIDISAYEGRMHIRERLDDATTILELTSDPAAGITIEAGGETGRVDIEISAITTDTLDFIRGVYDLELYNPGDPNDVIRLVEGIVRLKQGVTR